MLQAHEIFSNPGQQLPVDVMKRTVLLALTVLMTSVSLAQTTYSVRFVSEWSATTHPSSFPPNPHMSPLIGGTHNASYSMWAPGETSRSGMEVMAETGGTLNLESEVNSHIGFGNTYSVISGGGVGTSPGSVETTFEIVASHPLVSLVSMVAPSPDWFVGVRDLPLLVDGEWVDTITIELFAWDAGTDSGSSYTSDNADTNPAEPVTALVDGVFQVNGTVPRLGTFTFECISGCESTTVSTDTPSDIPSSISLGQPWPNPASDHVSIPVDVKEAATVRIDIVDILGRSFDGLTYSLPSSGRHDIRIPTGELASGLWHVRLAGPDGVVTRSFLIRR